MPLLEQALVFLAAAVLAVPLFRRLGLGSVLGYLAAGVVIGPWVLGLATDVDAILHFGEIGVVFLLFIIGLELQPARLRIMRRLVFRTGLAQVAITGVVLALAGLALGLSPAAAAVAGFGLSLSSTAFVLQMLAERKELSSPHGRVGFGVLLFQDLAAIPLIAAVPMLAGNGPDPGPGLLVEGLQVVGLVAAMVVGGHFLLRPVLRTVAAAGVQEIFTAAALLLVISAGVLMESVGISMGLGAFLAGVLVADSEYRHQLEADIEPFKGLLLGLFFMAVGMSVNLGLVLEAPLQVLGLALGLYAVKAALLYPMGRLSGLDAVSARRLALVLGQGGEFAFVVFTAADASGVLAGPQVELLTVAVALSMALTPLLYLVHERLARKAASKPEYDRMEDHGTPVIIAGFGRFGQIAGRLLTVQGIAFTALEANPGQVDFVRRFGHRVYSGDAARLDLLRAAGAAQARVLLVTVDSPRSAVAIVSNARAHFPGLRILARARNRQHALALRNAGAQVIMRETYLSSLYLAGEMLQALGSSADDAARALELFREHDEKTLEQQYAIRHDDKAMVQSAREAAEELRELFEQDRRGETSGD